MNHTSKSNHDSRTMKISKPIRAFCILNFESNLALTRTLAKVGYLEMLLNYSQNFCI